MLQIVLYAPAAHFTPPPLPNPTILFVLCKCQATSGTRTDFGWTYAMKLLRPDGWIYIEIQRLKKEWNEVDKLAKHLIPKTHACTIRIMPSLVQMHNTCMHNVCGVYALFSITVVPHCFVLNHILHCLSCKSSNNGEEKKLTEKKLSAAKNTFKLLK